MITETKKVVALAALIVATGVAAVETTRSSVQTDPMIVAGGAAGYAGARVDRAFELTAAAPQAAALTFKAAVKGDLAAIGCAALPEASAAAECMAAADEVASAEPTPVVETRRGASSSILMRLSRITVAGF